MSKKDKLVMNGATQNSKSVGSSELELKGKRKNSMAVPKLRFPEFRGEWEIEQMGDIYSFRTTNSFSRENLNYEEGEVKNIHYGDIHTKLATLFDITMERVPFVNPSISIEKINSECYCIEGDMVFADASEDLKDIGKSIEIVNLNNEKLLSGLHTLLARQKELKLAIGFGGYLFTSQHVRAQIQNEAQGSKVLGISATRLSKINIFYPKQKEEQQKIASCLSSLDELITAHHQKLEALKVHKKGLMKQLFPAEGETVPKLRFPEFKDSGEWEFSSIGSKVESISGYPFPGSEISEDAKGIPLMRGINVTEGFIRHSTDIDRYYKGEIQTLKKFLLRANDLVISMDGSKVGKNSALITEFDSGSLLVQRVARLRASDIGAIRFIFQQINSSKFHSYVDRINTSGGIPHISLKQIEAFEMYFPPKAKEQQKIASLLSALDDLISTQTQKIETLKAHKKGLMQQLFPAINPLDE